MAGLLLPASGGKLFLPGPRKNLDPWTQSAPFFPFNGIRDPFNRADESPLAGGWLGPIENGQPQLKLVSNQAADIGASYGQSYWSTLMGADQEVFSDIAVKTGAGATISVWTRIQNPGDTSLATGYTLFVNCVTGLIRLQKLTAGHTYTNLSGGFLTQPVSNGDGLGLSSIVDRHYFWYRVGASGTWKPIGVWSDASISGSGYIGLGIDDTTGRVGNFGGGAIPVVAGITLALGIASETDAAVALTARKSLALGIASETDAAQALAHSKSKAIAAALETDTAVNIKTVLFGRALETDTAMPIGHSKVKAIAPALETDSARLIVPGVARARETDTAQALGRLKSRTLGQALETDTAPALGRSKVKAIGAASELEVALPITASGGATPLSKGPFKNMQGHGF